MNKILVICGPTSTGKTKLALHLARKFGGEILSADSRQVYKDLNIGTGKDLPRTARFKTPWFKNFGFYEIEKVKVWGYDLVDPRKDFSVAQYVQIADKIIREIEGRKKLPILVGGTGLYIKAIIDRIPTAVVPKNKVLRKGLNNKSPQELFEMLAQLDPLRAGGMNQSDKQNPRRLIRAIEISISKKRFVSSSVSSKNTLFIGLTTSQENLFKLVQKRVSQRINEGIEKEIKGLLKSKISWKHQSMNSLGYRQWQDFFEGRISKKEAIANWIREERKYTKRQIVWFKKDIRIKWFDISNKNFTKKVEKTAEKWYKANDDKKG